ncbi:hypothetical protein [Halomarina rubra]|uniref:Uncharacterized protein n=1 Tax=Halomarina rubra TaxID=2071873 RepID=A0ABD6B1E6_9EURY|nr:hypothetical protein [Halomarina rubra]
MIDWMVPEQEWERFRQYVVDKYGVEDSYLGHEAAAAMREYSDTDGFADAEKRLDQLVSAAGRSLGGEFEERINQIELTPTTRVTVRVHEDIKDEFRAFVADSDDTYGQAFARAIQEYRLGGRSERLTEKLDRVFDDAEALLETVNNDSDGGLRKNGVEMNTIAICHLLDDQFTNDQLNDAIVEIVGDPTVTERTRSRYRNRVVDRLEVEPHPSGSPVWITEKTAREWVGEHVPRESRLPVEFLDREQRELRVKFELGRMAMSNSKGRKGVSAATVRTDMFGDDVAKSTVGDIVRSVAEDAAFELRETPDALKLHVNLGEMKESNAELLTQISEYYHGEKSEDTAEETREPERQKENSTDVQDEWDALDSATPSAIATDGGYDGDDE